MQQQRLGFNWCCSCLHRSAMLTNPHLNPTLPACSLREHLAAKCGGAGTPAFQAAQRAFAESLAAYSLVCYLLQIKDR